MAIRYWWVDIQSIELKREVLSIEKWACRVTPVISEKFQSLGENRTDHFEF